jgi:GntR family transcriptional regulator
VPTVTDPLETLQPVVTDIRSLPVQVAGQIRGLLSRDDLRPGQQLPTEASFAARFGVGRTTVREALKLLENDGLIQVRRGLGRFVSAAPALRRPLTRLESVTELMTSAGYQVTSRVLSASAGSPAPDERDALKLAERSEVVRLERLRMHSDEPYIYSVDVMPRSYFPADLGEVDWTGSLLDFLDGRGARPAYSVAQISAVHLPAGLAAEHGLAERVPWLLMIQVNTTAAGEPVIYSHDYHRGDRFSFDVLRRAQPS